MKRIVRLTESDLVKLVKRVISEQEMGSSTCLNDLMGHLREDGVAFTPNEVKTNCGALAAKITPTTKTDSAFTSAKEFLGCKSAVGESMRTTLLFVNCVKTGVWSK
jgi:hypothetical protein